MLRFGSISIKTLLTMFFLATLVLHAPVIAYDAGSGITGAVNAWRFRVFLDDKEIGYHNFFVAERGGMKQLKSVASFEYKLLFVSLFHYEHENFEIWSGDCLQSVNSRTDANGELFRVEGRQEGNEFQIESTRAKRPHPIA